jgi:hypothetical protein
MKKFGAAVAALALTAAFSSAAMAEPVDLTACTKDGKSITVKIDAEGGVKGGKTVAQIAQQAWTEAAAESTAAELSASPQAFAKHLQADIAAIVGDKDPAEVFTPDAGLALGAPPTVGGNCTAPAPAAK